MRPDVNKQHVDFHVKRHLVQKHAVNIQKHQQESNFIPRTTEVYVYNAEHRCTTTPCVYMYLSTHALTKVSDEDGFLQRDIRQR